MKIFILAVIVAMTSFFASEAVAQTQNLSKVLITLYEISPSKAKQFDAAWGVMKERMQTSDYSYSHSVGGNRTTRWIYTPIENFDELDTALAARKAIMSGGGRKFKNAVEKFKEAIRTEHEYIIDIDNDLSYFLPNSPVGTYMEITTYYYDYGKEDEVQSVLIDYKKLMEAKEIPYGYQVSWDGLGTIGASFTIVNAASNPVALAQAQADIDSLLQGNAEWYRIQERFLAINTDVQAMVTNWYIDASVNPPNNRD